MWSQNLHFYELPMTKKLLTNVKNAWSRYFLVLDERCHTKDRSEKAEKLVILDAGIDKINKEISLFQSTMKDLRAEADKAMIVAEKQTSFAEIKSTIWKCNALKGAADEKELDLDKAIAKKKVLLKKEVIVALITLLNSFSCFVEILQFLQCSWIIHALS